MSWVWVDGAGRRCVRGLVIFHRKLELGNCELEKHS